MGVITIPYKPRKWAELLHSCQKRWMVLVLHRRAGKTTAVLNHLQRDALRNAGTKYAYIAPTYKQAKLIAWDIIKHYSKDIPGIKYNEAELKVIYPNGSTLYLFGSENVDSLRGIALWGVGLDENSQQPSNLFSEVISKCLADNLGYCIWLGTPKGKNQFFKTYENAKNNEDWLALFRTIEDTIKTEEGKIVDNLKLAYEDDKRLVIQGQMTQEEFDQEWNCSFEAAIKGAYYAKEIAELRKSRFKPIPYDPILKVYTVWDLGVGQQLAIGFYQKTGSEVKMIDFWQGSNNDGIIAGIKACQNKPYIYGGHFAPHDINAREETTGKTRIATAKELNFIFQNIPNVSVDNGINKGKLLMAKLWVNSINCEGWIDAVSQYRQEWDDNRGCFRDTPYHDWTSHPADVHRYASLVEDKFNNNSGPNMTFQPEWEPRDDYYA